MPKQHPLTYQPSWKAYGKWMSGIPRIAIVFVTLFLFLVSYRVGGLATLLVVVTGVTIGMLYAWLYIKTVKFTVTESDVTYKSLFRTKRVSRKNFTAVLVNYLVSSGPPRPVNMLIMQDSTTGDSIRLNGAFWDNDIEAIAKLVSAKNLLSKGSVTDKEFAKEYPALRSWTQRHPAAFVVIIVLCTLLVVGVVTAIVFTAIGPYAPRN